MNDIDRHDRWLDDELAGYRLRQPETALRRQILAAAEAAWDSADDAERVQVLREHVLTVAQAEWGAAVKTPSPVLMPFFWPAAAAAVVAVMVSVVQYADRQALAKWQSPVPATDPVAAASTGERAMMGLTFLAVATPENRGSAQDFINRMQQTQDLLNQTIGGSI